MLLFLQANYLYCFFYYLKLKMITRPDLLTKSILYLLQSPVTTFHALVPEQSQVYSKHQVHPIPTPPLQVGPFDYGSQRYPLNTSVRVFKSAREEYKGLTSIRIGSFR